MGLLRGRHDDPHLRFQMREKLISIGDDYWIENESNANTDATAYPLLGRTYFVELRYAFR